VKVSDMRQMSRLDSLFVLCLLAALALLAVWLEGCLRKRQFKLTPRMLCWLAYRRRITITLCFPALPGLLFLLSAHYGGMSLTAALWSMAVIWGLALVATLPALQMQRRIIRSSLKRCGKYLPALAGEQLTFAGTCWVYADADWLICVGGGSSALIYAPEIDFTRPAGLRPYFMFTASGKSERARIVTQDIVLFARDGSERMLRMAREGMFDQWLRQHGGCFDFEKPRRKCGRSAKNR